MNMHIAAALQPSNWPILSGVLGKGRSGEGAQAAGANLDTSPPAAVLMGGTSAQKV